MTPVRPLLSPAARRGIFFCAGFLLLSCRRLAAADDVLSVSALNASKEEWVAWMDMPLKVEGRVSGNIRKHEFRFIHCDVPFRGSEEQIRTADKAENIEVSGRFKRDKETGKLFFSVERVKVILSDAEQFVARESKLRSTKAVDWYELADWAETRGKFYRDDELLTKARRARVKGLQFERTALPPDDPEARLALAKRYREQEIDSRLSDELTHEAARILWQRSQKEPAKQADFAKWVRSAWPSSAQPVESIPAELSKRYEANPLETYRHADDESRRMLSRLLLIQVELATLLPRRKGDGSNAGELAEELRTRVPERTDLIDKYRQEAFEWRLKSIARATRGEALKLAEELKSREQPDAARNLLKGWIRAQEQRLRRDGPIGLLQLAEEYLQLAEDEPTAVNLLAEAHDLDSSFTDASDRLKQLGYRLDQKKWVKGDNVASPAPDALIPGQLAVGMSSQDVFLLLGEPTGKTRILTSKAVTEVWAFGRHGTSRLLIHLQQAPGGALKVTRFLTEGRR